ncbi:MAG TPA: dihydrolipoamide acetyltransferase family protein [Gemmatimonadaceae bacterium]|nr:dihydrolipoamide acetyltransferase family protein [Gemmatimonadaceae bacterium]
MARVDVPMPQMGESIAEGTVSKWLKKVGDVVKRDEPIFEISTDKVDAEIPSPTAGRLAEILVGEGTTVAVQTIVARIETDVAAAVPASAPAAAPAPSAAPAPAIAASAPAAPVAAVAKAPTGNGNGSSFEERVRTKSSPLVRKIAAEHGIELSSVSGSGIAGRVTKRDIESLVANRGAAPKAPTTGRPAAPHVVHEGPLPEPWEGDVVEPMSKMRALISDHMVLSRRTSAHVTSVFEVDLTRVARIRAKKRAEFEAASGQRLSFMPFIIKATVDGLRQFPALNASVAGHDVIYRKQYNIGIAVALDWGLIVPVIKHADELSMVGITRQLNDLANRARSKRLKPEEVEEGTFTITNPGVFGSLLGTPIINQPQVAIMGIGAIEKRPKVIEGEDGEDTIAIRTCAYLTLSFDHRLIDGAVADEFLAFVKKQLETFPEAAL